ncbi:FMN reductase [Tateyamaria omphalii]|uniref:NADPH-dependent FMN reductase n=1 Tax=Tateyamaria omphalii TaxID=299262 RepID=UPI00167195EA|nr:NAD(P)H-dependent oxidoreductase [Tateyamaria omphalii]GGX38207.1 FMN reductase [Tateyamaria omphalii]
MHILAFGASNSTTSINARLARHASQVMATEIAKGAEIHVLDLNEFEMPIYSPEREEAHGIPGAAHAFHAAIQKADVLIISYAEHNGSYTAAFKNILDWTSRINVNVWQDKPALFMSASGGEWGGGTVLATAAEAAPYLGGDVRAHLAVGPWQEKFNETTESLSDPELIEKLRDGLKLLTSETLPA